MQSAAYFGLRPAQHISGVVRPVAGQIQSGYATNIFKGYPVALDANGYVTAAAAGSRCVGSFHGVEYTDSLGKRTYSNKWIASTTATDIVAYFFRDPGIVYEIQANAPLSLAAMGQQYDWDTLAGNSMTGIASMGLNVSSADTNAGLRVVGLSAGPDNAWGDPFPVVLVEIAEHQLVADRASV